MKPDLSIIVPAFNEQERISGSIKKILDYIKKENLNAELIVVDDGSSDDTSETAKKACGAIAEIPTKVVRYEQNRGKGFAVQTGLREALGEIALFSDADLSTPIEELPKLVAPIESGEFDLTFGSRALDRNLIGAHQPWRREQSGKVFNFMVRAMTGLPFADTQCGFKAFRMSKFRLLLDVMRIERFGFDVEFLFVANFSNLRLREISVRWDHCEGSKINVLRDSQKMFREINQIRRNARRGIYGVQTPARVFSKVGVSN
jgi:dolichyl-phosphate beta-glucosyltransferase